MYAYYPLQLPAVADDLPNTFDIGARFEMGGVCGCAASPSPVCNLDGNFASPTPFHCMSCNCPMYKT